MVLKLALTRKDNLLKLWFEYALEEDVKVSYVIAKAVEYHQQTKKYLQIGTVSNENMLKDIYKNIYYSKGSFLEKQILDWKAKGLRPSSEVKRILRGGIKATGVFTVISEIDAYDAVAEGPQVEEIRYVSAPERKEPANNLKERPAKAEHKEKKEYAKAPVLQEETKKPKTDFVLGMIAEGCGLGED